MAISTDPDAARTDRRTPFGPLRSLSRYDLTLLVVPLAFLCSFALGTALSVPTRTVMVVASLCGAAAVTDALFLNPPTGR